MQDSHTKQQTPAFEVMLSAVCQWLITEFTVPAVKERELSYTVLNLERHTEESGTMESFHAQG